MSLNQWFLILDAIFYPYHHTIIATFTGSFPAEQCFRKGGDSILYLHMSPIFIGYFIGKLLMCKFMKEID